MKYFNIHNILRCSIKILPYLYSLFLITPFLMKNKKYGFTLLISGLITFIATHYENPNSNNSRWCFFQCVYTPYLDFSKKNDLIFEYYTLTFHGEIFPIYTHAY